MNLTAIIIDDEEDARKTLRHFLDMYCPMVKLLGEADGVQTGIQLLSQSNPDLVLLDIQMEDGTGFDLLEAVENNFSIIFTTAFDKYAVKAFKFSAVDYLLKPIDPDELQRAIDKLDYNEKANSARRSSLLQNVRSNTLDKITVSATEGYFVLDISEIVRVESSNNYSRLHQINGSKITLAKSLKDFEELLPSDRFLRIHQSHLVNLSQIKSFSHDNGGRLTLANGTTLPVARRRKEDLLAMLPRL